MEVELEAWSCRRRAGRVGDGVLEARRRAGQGATGLGSLERRGKEGGEGGGGEARQLNPEIFPNPVSRTAPFTALLLPLFSKKLIFHCFL